MKEAISYLLISESDFRTLQIYSSLLDVQYLLSVVYHNLGMGQERDEVAKRHVETQIKQRNLEALVIEDEVQQILEVVGQVGAGLAGRM